MFLDVKDLVEGLRRSSVLAFLVCFCTNLTIRELLNRFFNEDL